MCGPCVRGFRAIHWNMSIWCPPLTKNWLSLPQKPSIAPQFLSSWALPPGCSQVDWIDLVQRRTALSSSTVSLRVQKTVWLWSSPTCDSYSLCTSSSGMVPEPEGSECDGDVCVWPGTPHFFSALWPTGCSQLNVTWSFRKEILTTLPSFPHCWGPSARQALYLWAAHPTISSSPFISSPFSFCLIFFHFFFSFTLGSNW